MANLLGELFSAVSAKGFYTGNAAEVVTIKLHGMEQLKARLKELSDIGKKEAIGEALRVGGKVIQSAIKAKAPLGTTETVTKGRFHFPPGSLKKSIVVRKKTDRYDKYNIKYQVGPDRKIAFYAHMVEFGTKEHGIPLKPGKLLKFKRTSGGMYRPEFISEQSYYEAFTGGGRKVSGGYVYMKGVRVAAKRHPFVRPGFDSSRVRATTVIQERLLKAIDKIAKKEAVA